MSNKASLYFFPSDASKGQDTKKLEGVLYIKKPFKVFIDSRPAVLRYKQEIKFEDPKNLGAKPQMVTIQGYFKRVDVDAYRQLSQEEVKKVLGWMARNDVKPNDLTMEQAEQALASKIELDDEPSLVVPGAEEVTKSKGGIILPG
jgi:hypothetical protein